MAGENVDKIKFSVNGKDITLREGERLGNDKRKLKDLGSLWDKITQDNKLDKNELDMFKKLDQILNKNGEWNSVQMQSIAKEFEESGQTIGDFLDLKLKEKEPKALVAQKAEVKTEAPKLQTPKGFETKEAEMERRAKMKEEQRKAELEAKYVATHTVSENETLALIAKKLLQDAGNAKPTKEQILDLVNEIAEVNGIEDIGKIKPGQKLRLPAEVGNVGFKSTPKTKEPTADEIWSQITLPDEVAALVKEFKGIDTPDEAGAFAEKVDTREAAYVLQEVFFGITGTPPVTNEVVTKNVALADMVEKMLDRAKELNVDLGGEYTVKDIIAMNQDAQIGLINEISKKVIDAEPMHDIKVGKYVSKDEQGRDDRVVLVTVAEEGLHVEHRDYKHNIENAYSRKDRDLTFPKEGTYELLDSYGNVKSTHVVTNEGARMKVVTTTLTRDQEIVETWYVDEGRDKAKKEFFLREKYKWADDLNVHDASGKTQDINGKFEKGKIRDDGIPLDFTVTSNKSGTVFKFELVKVDDNGNPIYKCMTQDNDKLRDNAYLLTTNKDGFAELVQCENQPNFGKPLQKAETLAEYIARLERDLEAYKEENKDNKDPRIQFIIKAQEDLIARKKVELNAQNK